MDGQLTAPLPRPTRGRSRWRSIAAVAGPGLVVMLADTDAGSVITAAQSGAQWGYRLLLLQAILIPILYVVLERLREWAHRRFFTAIEPPPHAGRPPQP